MTKQPISLRVSEIEQDPGVELHQIVMDFQGLYEMCDNLRICGIDADIITEVVPSGWSPIARARLYDVASATDFDSGYGTTHLFFLCVPEKE